MNQQKTRFIFGNANIERRISEEMSFPYLTDDGLVLQDRRDEEVSDDAYEMTSAIVVPNEKRVYQ